MVPELYDYIYTDTDKVISVYSQLTGGVVELRETLSGNVTTQDKNWNLDVKVLKHDRGSESQDKKELKETVKPYHSIFSELEENLVKNGHLLDLSSDIYRDRIREPEFRDLLKRTFCVKVTGRCVIEDYERMKSIAEAFPKVAEFVNKGSESALKNSEPIAELNRQIEQKKTEIAQIKDKNKRAQAKASLKTTTRKVDQLLAGIDRVGNIDQWILDGMKTWINTFLPGIVNLRVYPSNSHMDVQVFGHLKKKYFADPDSDPIHFTYGSMPTECITLVGIVTSVPMDGGDNFVPLQEFQNKELSDTESIENAFRGVFRGFDGMEQMIRTCRFPRILVYPLLVYRKASPNRKLQEVSNSSS